jgi:hypothetical protein
MDITPPFRKRIPTISLPIIDVDVTRQVQDQTDVKTMIDDNEDDGSTPNTRRPSYLDELNVHIVTTEDLAPSWLDASSTIDDFLNAIDQGPLDFSRKIDDVMEVIDDDFTFAKDKDRVARRTSLIM